MSIFRKIRKSKNTGYHYGPTLGLSSPKNSRRGCLCLHSDTYSVDCCDGLLIQQGIGNIDGVRQRRGAFSSAFSNDFDNTIDT
jgi:hypothetical protein